MAYLAYNFLNADTARTRVGMQDDLMYKWNRHPSHGIDGLALSFGFSAPLSDQGCATCAAKGYFHPGGSAMPTAGRLALLHHNWRVANFVNNPNIAEGQYGYPAWSGFSPATQLHAWQTTDGTSKTDIVALPATLNLGPSVLTRDTTLQGSRAMRGMSHPMTLTPYGANYWVIRPPSTLMNINHDLTVRVSPRALFKKGGNGNSPGHDVRLMASLVGYNQQDTWGDESALWQVPQAAAYATEVKWVDCDSTAGAIDLVLPNFGNTYKAALLVVTLADGPAGQFAGESGLGYIEALPYRLDVSYRNAASPSLSQQPIAVSTFSGTQDDWCSWSPTCDAVAYSAFNTAISPYSQIYRRGLDGSTPQRMYAQNLNQYCPDWSPRGDRVAIVTYEDPAAMQDDIYVADTAAAGLAAWKVSSLPGWSTLPAFQPNGEGIAYLYISNQTGAQQLRWVGVDGSGDRLIASVPTILMVPPRWTRDGRHVVVCHASTHQLVRYRVSDGLMSADPAGAQNIRSFDLHPGKGRLAVVSADSLCNFARYADGPGYFLDNSAFAVSRVALLDTNAVSRDSSYRFVARGYDAANVRWSPDGTKIAYSREVAGQNGNRDIYVGRVTWNRAPELGEVVDQGIPACAPFTLEFTATDPDGEPISYEAAQLPPGSYMQAPNIFRWQFPQTGEYSMVFRALDGSGGVKSKVVHLSVFDSEYCYDGLAAGGGDGDALAMARGAGMLASGAASTPTSEENSLLDGTAPESWADQFARVGTSHVGEGGVVSLSLRMGTGPGADVDRVQFLTADHASGSMAFATSQGIVAGLPVSPLAVTGLEGPIHFAEVAGVEPYFASQGSTVAVSGDTSGISAVIVNCRRASTRTLDPSAGIAVQVEQNGAWTTVDRLQPRRDFDALAAQVPHAANVRLVFGADVLVESVKVLSAVSEPALTLAEPGEGTMTEALGLVGAADGEAWHLEPGESVPLVFAPNTTAPQEERSYFLRIRGRYLAAHRSESMRSQQAGPELKLAFEAPRPNPFSRNTTLAYSLPLRGQVRIEVMDAQGRRVRTLRNQVAEPGRYSVEWDGRDNSGHLSAPGIYLARMVVGAQTFQRRLVLIP